MTQGIKLELSRNDEENDQLTESQYANTTTMIITTATTTTTTTFAATITTASSTSAPTATTDAAKCNWVTFSGILSGS